MFQQKKLLFSCNNALLCIACIQNFRFYKPNSLHNKPNFRLDKIIPKHNNLLMCFFQMIPTFNTITNSYHNAICFQHLLHIPLKWLLPTVLFPFCTFYYENNLFKNSSFSSLLSSSILILSSFLLLLFLFLFLFF